MNSLMEMVHLRKRKWINYSYYGSPFRTHSIPLRKHSSNITKFVLLYEYIMVDQVLQTIFSKIYNVWDSFDDKKCWNVIGSVCKHNNTCQSRGMMSYKNIGCWECFSIILLQDTTKKMDMNSLHLHVVGIMMNWCLSWYGGNNYMI